MRVQCLRFGVAAAVRMVASAARVPGTVTAVLALGLLALASPTEARHFNRGAFVPAFEACDQGDANALTSGGVAACEPAKPFSNCTSDPGGALRLGARARTGYNVRPTGRRETRENDGRVDILTTMRMSGIETCAGESFSGTLDAEMILRVTREDPDCASGECTLPDFSMRHPIDCTNGRCELIGFGVDALAAGGLPPLPSDHEYVIQALTVKLLDLSGNALLVPGFNVGDRPLEQLFARGISMRRVMLRFLASLGPRDADAYGSVRPGPSRRNEARYVQAFLPCLAGTEDTLTADGLAACTSRPVSDCALDPTGALVAEVPPTGFFSHEGVGKINLAINRTRLAALAQIRGVADCSLSEFSGNVTLQGRSRVTLRDPACGGSGICTAVDAPLFSLEVPMKDGEIRFRSRSQLGEVGPFPGAAEALSAELLGVDVLDPSGNVAMTGPSLLVRCNADGRPNESDGPGFCFGN